MKQRKGDPSLAIAYLRLSPRGKRDDDPLGFDVQRDMIQKFATAKILSWHEDKWISGGDEIENRPGLLNAMADLRTYRAGILYVAKWDRLARDRFIEAMISRLIEREGAIVLSADGIGNGDDPASQAMRGLMAVFAQFERAIIKSRTVAALAAKRHRGERLGGMVPLGYRVEGKMLIPDAQEQAAITRIRELRDAGKSYQAIVDTLTREKITCRAPGGWHLTTIRRILAKSNTAGSDDRAV